MTDKESEKQIKRIKRFIHKWRAAMGLNWFQIDVEYDRSYSKDNSGAKTYMERWMYREFDITFFLPNISDLNDEKLESVVIHELAHCLTAPMACTMIEGNDEKSSRDLMEQTTTIVANALEWVYKSGQENAIVKPIKENK